MHRPTAVERMRQWAPNYMLDEVWIYRDVTDFDDWQIDEVSLELTEPEPVDIWRGCATIQMPDQTRSREEIDRMEVHLPADVAVERHDILEIVQSRKDGPMRDTGPWYVIDVDYGTHHVTRRLVCARRNRKPDEIPATWMRQ